MGVVSSISLQRKIVSSSRALSMRPRTVQNRGAVLAWDREAGYSHVAGPPKTKFSGEVLYQGRWDQNSGLKCHATGRATTRQQKRREKAMQAPAR
jgi:hypothetical protein